MTKKTSRQLQAEETRKRIVLCYLDIIREKPPNEVKITELCQRAGVSVGTYYHHFKNKYSVIRDIYYHIDERFNVVCQELQADSYVDRVLEYITYTGQEAQNYYGLRAATTIYQLQMNIEGAFFLDTTRPFSQNLCDLLRGAVEAGELPPNLDVRSTVLDLLCIFRGIVYSWCLLKGELDIEGTIYATVSAYMESLNK